MTILKNKISYFINYHCIMYLDTDATVVLAVIAEFSVTKTLLSLEIYNLVLKLRPIVGFEFSAEIKKNS